MVMEYVGGGNFLDLILNSS